MNVRTAHGPRRRRQSQYPALLRRVVEAGGYHVMEAWTGQDAMRLIETDRGPIEVLVTDVHMSGIGGVELGERIALRHPRIRILFMSGVSDAAAERLASTDRGRAFLTKPFTGDEFLAAVRDLLDA